jgi:hypothetical protein
MNISNLSLVAFVLLLVAVDGFTAVQAQQVAPAAGATQPAPSSDEAARQQILQSARWQNAARGMEQWLSVQQLYTPQEVTVLKAQFKARVGRMSPAELEKQLADMEAKLAVLSSPEADDARRWLAQFLAVQAKYSPEQLRQMRPDVANMTAAQIRDELQQFQSRRGQAQLTQSASAQGRALQLQSARNVQDTRRQSLDAARSQAAQNASTAATFAQPSQPPRQQTVPVPIGPPIYTVGPWGNPLRWDPMVGFW